MCPDTRETLLPTSEEIDARFDYILKHPEEETEADKWLFRKEYMDLNDISDDYDTYEEEGDYEDEEDEED